MKSLAGKYLILALFVTLFSCTNQTSVRDIDAKIIDYRIEYLDNEVGGIPTNVFPQKMELIFAGPYAKNTITGFMGQFSLSYIANREKETVTTFLKIMNDKYYYPGKPGEMPVGVDPMQEYSLSDGGKEKVIAGIPAKEMILKRPGKEDFTVYTTRKLNIEAPNITTPYRGEKDVLLVFYTSLSQMEMVLTAEDYRQEKVSTEIFFVQEDYKKLSRASMERAIEELFRN